MIYNKAPSFDGYNYSEEEIEYARKNNKLLRIGLETSRICNLRCLYCYASAGKPLPNEVSFEQITSTIDQAIELGAKTIVIIGGGEPLMYGNILNLIEYIDNKGKKTVLFTNGTLVTKKIAKFLFDKNVSVVAKLNSFNKQFQEFLNGGILGSHDKAIQGINNLIEAGLNKTNPTRLALETVMIKENYNETPKLWEWARKRNIHPYFEMIRIAGRAALMEGVNLTNEEVQNIFHKLLEIDRKKFNYDWIPLPPIVAQSCKQHLYSCYMNSLGDIWPCSGVTIKMGNIKNEKLKDILEKSLFKKLRNLENNIEGKCKTCKYNKLHCFGCRGRVYNAIKNVFGEDFSCWKVSSSP